MGTSCDPEQNFYNPHDLVDADADVPAPKDKRVLDSMISRAMLAVTLIAVIALVVVPSTLIGVGLAAFHIFGVPVCGAVGHIEVLETESGDFLCGTKVAWEFYLGIVIILMLLGLVFFSMIHWRQSLLAGRKRAARYEAQEDSMVSAGDSDDDLENPEKSHRVEAV